MTGSASSNAPAEYAMKEEEIAECSALFSGCTVGLTAFETKEKQSISLYNVQ